MATNVDIINLALGSDYEDRIPKATKDNLSDVAEAIMNYEPAKNRVLTEVYNKIALTLIRSMRFTNPLEVFRGEDIRYGDTIEDLFVEIPKGYDPRSVSHDPFTKVQPSVKALYKSINSEIQYEQTITDYDFRKALRSQGGLTSLVNTIVGNMAVAGGTDDFLKIKQVIADRGLYGKIAYLGSATGTDATDAKTLLKAIKDMGSFIKFPSKLFNAMSVLNTTPVEDQVLLIQSKWLNKINIDVLTGYFNLDEGEISQRIIEVDDFNDSGIVAVLCDKKFIDYRKSLQDGGMIYNPKGTPYTNYFYNVYGLYSASMFMNAVAFVFSDPETVSVSITVTDSEGHSMAASITGSDGTVYEPTEGVFTLPADTFTVSASGYNDGYFTITNLEVSKGEALTETVILTSVS